MNNALCSVLRAVFVTVCAGTHAVAQAPPPVTRVAYNEWMAAVSNAGRWGAQDELGTLNLITPEKRRRASQSVRVGVTISLAHDIVAGPNQNAIQPFQLQYTISPADSVVTWTVDQVTLFAHGWAYSHLDALSHSMYRGRLYNGFGQDQIPASGAQKLGIHAMRDGIVSRGILIDLPRLRNRAFLEPGTAIMATDLEEWERVSKVKVEPGDVLLIRTGRVARAAAQGEWQVTRGTAGPHPSIALWLKQRGVAALGSDVANEFYPSVVQGISDPLHHLALAGMGMPFFDNLNLEPLAAEAARSRPTFLFVAAPLRVRGGSGSAVNPLAIF